MKKKTTAPAGLGNATGAPAQGRGSGDPVSDRGDGELEWAFELPEISDELRLADAAARLGGKSQRTICPRCGELFLTGRGHLGSDFCLARAMVKLQGEQGFVRVPTWQWADPTGLLAKGGVELRRRPGSLEHCPGRFRGVRARESVYAPRWSLRVARATIAWDSRRRVALLQALQLPELAEVLEFVKTSQHVPRGLFAQATTDTRQTAAALLSLWVLGQQDKRLLRTPRPKVIEGGKVVSKGKRPSKR